MDNDLFELHGTTMMLRKVLLESFKILNCSLFSKRGRKLFLDPKGLGSWNQHVKKVELNQSNSESLIQFLKSLGIILDSALYSFLRRWLIFISKLKSWLQRFKKKKKDDYTLWKWRPHIVIFIRFPYWRQIVKRNAKT